MIKIKIYDLDKHRNEITFRSFITNEDLFREIGIEFTTGETYDYAWIGHMSFCNKKVSLDQSIQDGLEYLSKITGDYMLFDGQDATSLMGTADVLRHSRATAFFKYAYLPNFNQYKNKYVNGRWYWGPGNYNVPDIDNLKDKMYLMGTNWGSTLFPKGNFKFYDLNSTLKKYDVCGMFQYPMTEKLYEHGLLQTTHYNNHRTPVFNTFDKLENRMKIIRLQNGKRISHNEYLQNEYFSKILVAPIGFGEYGSPRDIEAAQFSSVLLKPKMDDVVTTVPGNLYVDNETYIACKWDYSDLEEKIDYILSNFNELQKRLTLNLRKALIEDYNPINLVKHIYNIFLNLDKIKTDE
jgi:hypothetical protein